MGKLQCKCGFTINDYAVDFPHKGALVSNGSFFDYIGKIEEGIASLLEAVKTGKRDEWITKRSSTLAEANLNDAKVVANVFAQHYYDLRRLVFQCENCHRIWIQREGATAFVSFLPEDDDSSNILFRDDEGY